MNEIEEIFKALIGKTAWGVQQTHGSCFYIEFGDPRLKTLGPLNVSRDAPLEQILRTRRRRAILYGQWSLLIQDCIWTLRTWEITITQETAPVDMKASFDALSGQYLVSVCYDEEANSCTFEFDLGARLTTTPVRTSNSDWVQWTLNDVDGRYISLLSNGDLRWST
ncbi:hypothetical protein [Paraburkholderia oxyphila]|uniref:hypothetical protein n=1 Tax=Paraburkholderia oxyphila TaxID=614212 RepID=UPI0012ED73AE|nr:hypothetical protein [Paraburkholderia oxyphila]